MSTIADILENLSQYKNDHDKLKYIKSIKENIDEVHT
jgi:hypothetical protein